MYRLLDITVRVVLVNRYSQRSCCVMIYPRALGVTGKVLGGPSYQRVGGPLSTLSPKSDNGNRLQCS